MLVIVAMGIVELKMLPWTVLGVIKVKSRETHNDNPFNEHMWKIRHTGLAENTRRCQNKSQSRKKDVKKD